MLNLFIRFFFILGLIFLPSNAFAAKAEVKKSSYPLPTSSKNFTHIRVFLLGNLKQVEIKTFYPYTVTDRVNRKLLSGDSMPRGVLVKPVPKGIQFGPQTLRNLPIHLESHGEGFEVQGHTYRHILQIRSEPDGTLLLVNEIPIEDYLKSVLPSEMSAEWPFEALKAQAIASRTYAFFKMIENQKNEYDVRKDVISQAYRGKSLEHVSSTRAVRETQGQILTYKNKVFLSFFHSTCGGHTANIFDLWNMEEHPSLKGVECDFCRLSRHYKWSSEISKNDLESKLKKAGYSVFGLENFSVGTRDKGGRAKTIVIQDSKGKKTIVAGDFRFIAGPNKIKSTLLDKITKRGDIFSIRGKGWGHGAGLCQYGTRRLGELGYAGKQILRYYYPDSDITQFWPQNQYL